MDETVKQTSDRLTGLREFSSQFHLTKLHSRIHNANTEQNALLQITQPDVGEFQTHDREVIVRLGQRSQRHQMCRVMESRREGPFVRHQISSVPKAGPDRVSSAGVQGGETQALRTVSSFCLLERAPWIPPTGADRGQAGDRPGRGSETVASAGLPACLSLCVRFTAGL